MVTYKDAGVDINKSNEAKRRLKELVKQTHNKNVLANIGTFGALFQFNYSDYKNPVLVSSTDGVGTKIRLAIMSKKYNTVGQDLVNHCVNDILAMGARPLFFLDYIALGEMKPEVVEGIVEGFAKACKESECALIGGETAEMPGLYQKSDFDLAGFIVGVVDKEKIVNGQNVKEGDVVVGIMSNGLQTNGYSLANKIFFEIGKYDLNDKPLELKGKTVAESLMAIHPSYLKPIMSIMENGIEIKGMAHITGGGLLENLPRVLPNGTSAMIDKNTWEIPPVFTFMRKIGNVPERDMFRTFNMGIGYTFIVSKENEPKASEILSKLGIKHHTIGKIVEGNQEVLMDLDKE